MGPYILVFIIIALVGYTSRFNRIRKQKNKEVLTYEELINSKQDIILYLRAFDDDNDGNNFADPRINFLNRTYEEIIANELEKHYFVTVGRPGEELPKLGAYRFYIDSKNWKEQVHNLMVKSRFIIVKSSKSTGLNWELSNVFAHNFQNKLILFHQYGNYTDKEVLKYYYEELKKQFLVDFNIEMHEFDKKKTFSSFSMGVHNYSGSLNELMNL